MLDKTLFAFFRALIEAITARLEQRSTAHDATADRPLLHRAGKRISNWMRGNKDNICSRGQSDETRTPK